MKIKKEKNDQVLGCVILKKGKKFKGKAFYKIINVIDSGEILPSNKKKDDKKIAITKDKKTIDITEKDIDHIIIKIYALDNVDNRNFSFKLGTNSKDLILYVGNP